MALKDTCATMGELIQAISQDLQKASEGNKAAAQRVRTTSIKLEKVAKLYRKESVQAAKSGIMQKMKQSKRQAKAKKVSSGAKGKKTGGAKKKPAAKKAAVKRGGTKKATASKRPTAKLPKKKAAGKSKRKK